MATRSPSHSSQNQSCPTTGGIKKLLEAVEGRPRQTNLCSAQCMPACQLGGLCIQSNANMFVDDDNL